MLAKSSHQWLVDGEDIADVWTEGTDYEIATSDNDYLDWGDSQYNGTLSVLKNFGVNEGVTLQYKGVYNDGRTGFNQAVISDTISLTSVEEGVDEVGVYVSETEVVWNPLNDKHLLYDYLTGLGIEADADYNDGAQYDREVTIKMTSGGVPLDEVPDGYTMRIIDHATGEEVADDAFTWEYPTMAIDLRMMNDISLEVQVIYDASGDVLATRKLDVYFEMPVAGSLDMVNKAEIPASFTEWSNEVLVVAGKQRVTYPECYYDITWKVKPRVLNDSTYEYGEETVIGYGADLTVGVSDDLGLQTNSEQSWCVVSYTAAQRAACSFLTDDEEVCLTDGDGNTLIG